MTQPSKQERAGQIEQQLSEIDKQYGIGPEERELLDVVASTERVSIPSPFKERVLAIPKEVWIGLVERNAQASKERQGLVQELQQIREHQVKINTLIESISNVITYSKLSRVLDELDLGNYANDEVEEILRNIEKKLSELSSSVGEPYPNKMRPDAKISELSGGWGKLYRDHMQQRGMEEYLSFVSRARPNGLLVGEDAWLLKLFDSNLRGEASNLTPELITSRVAYVQKDFESYSSALGNKNIEGIEVRIRALVAIGDFASLVNLARSPESIIPPQAIENLQTSMGGNWNIDIQVQQIIEKIFAEGDETGTEFFTFDKQMLVDTFLFHSYWDNDKIGPREGTTEGTQKLLAAARDRLSRYQNSRNPLEVQSIQRKIEDIRGKIKPYSGEMQNSEN